MTAEQIKGQPGAVKLLFKNPTLPTLITVM
jgi:hypothetical protein